MFLKRERVSNNMQKINTGIQKNNKKKKRIRTKNVNLVERECKSDGYISIDVNTSYKQVRKNEQQQIDNKKEKKIDADMLEYVLDEKLEILNVNPVKYELRENSEEKNAKTVLRRVREKAANNLSQITDENSTLNITFKQKEHVNQRVSRRYGSIIDIIRSMNFKEMLETSKMIELILKNEELPDTKSCKVQICMIQFIRLKEKKLGKLELEILQRNLVDAIIKKNAETADMEKGKRLYEELMKKE